MAQSNILLAIQNTVKGTALTGDSTKVIPEKDSFLPPSAQGIVPNLKPFIELTGMQWSASRTSSGAIAADGSGKTTSNVSPGPLELFKQLDAATPKLASALKSGDKLEVYLMFLKAGVGVKGRETTDIPFFGYILKDALIISQEISAKPDELNAQERVLISYTTLETWYTPQKNDGQPGPQSNVQMKFHSPK